MDKNQTSRGTNRGEVPLQGLRLSVLRTLWLVLVLIDLVTLIVSLPGYYHSLFTLCPGPVISCPDTGQLNVQTLPTLLHAGFSLNTYALYVIFLDALTTLAFLLIGVLIIWRKSNTWMGLFVSFLLINFGSLGLSFAHELPNDSSNPLIDILGIASLIPTLLYYPCLSFFFSTFPDGRFVPRWSWALIGLWIVNSFFWVVGALAPASPLEIGNWPPLLEAGWLSVVFGGSASVQLYRFLCVASPVQRQQIKWLLYGFVPVIVLPLCLTLYMTFVPALNKPGAFLVNTPNSFLLIVTIPLYRFWYLPVPFCVGIALLRYRLWDIDIIIKRTLVYVALTLNVIGLYVLVVVGLGTLLQVQGNVLLSLLATALIAVFFQPLREWLQRGVNRLLYGQRDDPYAVLSRLGNRLEATLAPEKVLPTIVETIAQALKLPYVAIALLPEQDHTATTARTAETLAEASIEEPAIVTSSGSPSPDPLRVPLVYQAETIGHLLLAARAGDSFGKADSRLLTDLARQAGVAIYAVRLTTHLRHLTESLQESRERLVTTREEERRRLRRDLHDGLGPTLASLTFKVDAARNVLSQDYEKADLLLKGVRQQAQEAIADIRRLVYDLRPPALDELGLLSALREQVANSAHQGFEVAFDAPLTLPLLPAAVEVAAYRIAQEALTNVARHAEAEHCLLQLFLDAQALYVVITDDGKGIPIGHHLGVGLHAMHERASELGGSCTITRGESRGTVVQVTLPFATHRDATTVSAHLAASPNHANAQVDETRVATFEP